MSNMSFAKTTDPSIDRDLDYKVDSDFRETNRSVAATPTKAVVKDEDATDVKQDREVAGDSPIEEPSNSNGIRFWKMENIIDKR